MATYNTYPAEQEQFLKENAPLMSRKELTEQFNRKFGTNRTVSGIKGFCNARGYNSSSIGRFEKGNVSWQTGLRGEEFKSHYTEESYRRMIERAVQGNRTRKIGDELVIKGIPWIVTSVEPGVPFHKRRQLKRRVVWEQLHGEIPADHCIVHLDGDQMNCNPSNLYCMPTQFRPLLAKNQWWFGNAELTLAAIKWCELHYAIKNVNGSDK
jgi:hypothetical protein